MRTYKTIEFDKKINGKQQKIDGQKFYIEELKGAFLLYLTDWSNGCMMTFMVCHDFETKNEAKYYAAYIYAKELA